MRLVIIMASDKDRSRLDQALARENYCFTVTASESGPLKRKRVTFMSLVPAKNVNALVELVKKVLGQNREQVIVSGELSASTPGDFAMPEGKVASFPRQTIIMVVPIEKAIKL